MHMIATARRTAAVQFAFFFLVAVLSGVDATVGRVNGLVGYLSRSIVRAQAPVQIADVHPLARAAYDRGPAPADLTIERILLVLKRSPQQDAELERFMEEQLDEHSSNYHRWLEPEQFGQRFGSSLNDISVLVRWLESNGLKIENVSKGRTIIEFSGTAAAIERTFDSPIRKYVLNDASVHYANATALRIPAAFQNIVAGIRSLNDFGSMRRRSHVPPSRRPSVSLRPSLTLPQFPPGCGMQPADCYAIGPQDFGRIYNVLPLWESGIDGAGQTIVVIGESNINLQDTRDFRRLFGLPANDPTVILNGRNPGTTGDEMELEANTDVQWAGAVAPNANIVLVVSATTNSSFGGDLSAVYAVNRNLAPIITFSYNGCERNFGSSGNQFYNMLWQQAAAQGITVFVSTGDNGSAGCEDFTKAAPWPAQTGLAVSGVAATPWNVAVGGTDFDDVNRASQYWSTSNDPITHASATGYIPETTWNFSCTNRILGLPGYSPNPETNCNDSRLLAFVHTVGGSGGRSSLYKKPAWQYGPGVPNDGARDIPDVSLYAGLGRVSGSFYVVCMQTLHAGRASCDLQTPYGHFVPGGGTSLTTPAFAGIMALVRQYAGARQGNANAVFYRLAADQSGGDCASASQKSGYCIFHDVTDGSISMPCVRGSTNCITSSPSLKYGILSGYEAGPGYDLATGLGSVNVFNLVTSGAWEGQSFSIPVLEDDSVVNAATNSPGVPVAAGSIAAIFGDFPGRDGLAASTTTLPPMLSRLVVKIGPGFAAPLYFVSSGQVNVQIPWELAGEAEVPISVVLEGSISARRLLKLAPSAPGIFTINGQGTGQGAVVNSAYQLVDMNHPAEPEDTIQIYCTGLGPVTNQPPTGIPAPAEGPLSRTTSTPDVLIGGALGTVTFSGLAPGYAGLYQVNVRVPESATRGGAVSVIVTIGGNTSNSVTIALKP